MIFITKPWRLNIKDKKIISKKRICSPHWFPHKIPYITKPVINEFCHSHKRKWRMIHHIMDCKLHRCPNYQFMIQKYKEKKK